MTHVSRQGFTLIELLIVLVIIGLLVGGVLVGQSMIRNSQVQSVVQDVDTYRQAVQLFRDKYNYLPGDMPTAESFWGSDAGCPNTAYSAAEAAPKSATCNGDGNGSIDQWYETLRAWQELANGGFINSQYSGIQGNATAQSLAVGTDVPASKISGCGWMIGYIQAYSANGGVVQAGTYLALVGGGINKSFPPCLTPAESYVIDTKIDDGLPASGKMVDGPWPYYAIFGYWPWMGNVLTLARHEITWPCTSPAPGYMQYNSTVSKVSCTPFFNIGQNLSQ
jgi:prepilin-type N-terminal cleavage/methylation domain-containing protein